MTVTNLQVKYGHKYKVVDDGTDDPCRAERVWCQEIRGRCGVIYPYGYNGALAVRFDSKTRSKIDAWAARLLREGYHMVQQGDWEVVFRFNPKDMDYFAGLISAKRRRYLTPEQRAKAETALAKARKQRRQ